MEFFKTDEGVIHGNRIAGTVYTIILLTCGYAPALLCSMRVASTLGWWLAFCSKHPCRSWSGTVSNPARIAGIILVVLGIAGQFYVVWVTAHAGIQR
jgi:hypothetical protein